MNNIEDDIRDKLSCNLELIEPGLVLLDTESYLKNENGTRGFVDILAKDSLNRFVLIELKRSQAASRDALHEVLKYFEGIKENKSLKDDEIILYIVSTEWKELIVPYSRFVDEVSFNVQGYQLNIDSNNFPVSAQVITPLKVNNLRKLSQQCKVCFYKNESNLKHGIDSFEKSWMKKRINNFVLITLRNNNKEICGDFPYMIYAATQELSAEEYIEIIKMDDDLYNEHEELITDHSDLSDLEYLSILQGFAVDDAEPRVFFDRVAIGYPSKFNHTILEDEHWQVMDVLKYGKFKNNELLTDSVIIDELKGNAGENKIRYVRSVDFKNKASFDVVSKEINQCLLDNKIWRVGVKNALHEIHHKNDYKECSINIFNPMNTLRSIYKAYYELDQLPCNEGLNNAQDWIPNYKIYTENQSEKVLYLGMLKDNSNRMSLSEYFNDYYHGNEAYYFFNLLGVGYNPNDVVEAKSIGLEYSNFKIVFIKATNEINHYQFDGYEYQKTNEIRLNEDFVKFMLSEHSFMDELNKIFNMRFPAEGFVDISDYNF
ncbi:endonuclease NucS domain-containing protein [Serratia fonticola]|uniref:endonuclease NucS domain-containing protein n=1 Tax=Serratia fonticola TaxID=47917 RepID=UPI003AAD07A7